MLAALAHLALPAYLAVSCLLFLRPRLLHRLPPQPLLFR
jgi:hypothetical protein